ncbi:CsbD family protein [Mycolicibacterium mengxianglii]|uniref:CsbD family protein n=1 Tax=Mycolicibacterium mengxianglii TaxID=2736649 RepID=UPI0018D05C78|nr:CsbD family protein [Mycolicibacterium mengxianglii]
MGTADKAWIKVDKFTAQAKEKMGRATGNRRMEVEGRAGQMNAGVRSAGEKLKDAVRGRTRRNRTGR